jgi:uncharacterized protein (TIGR00369 family)
MVFGRKIELTLPYNLLENRIGMFNIENYKNIIETIIPFHRLLGIQLVSMENGSATLLVPFKPELVGDPRVSRIHGGVISTVMDAAGGAAGMTTLQSAKDLISTIDIRVDFIHPGRPEDILVEGNIVRDGSSLIFTTMRAFHPSDKETIAEGRAVYRVKRNYE